MSSSSRPTLTRAGLLLGARLCLPAVPGSMLFAATFGSVAAQKGLTFLETMVMTTTVFAGVSQLVAMELWRDRWTVGTLAAVLLVTAIINMRMVLMSAALRPALEHCPRLILYPALQQLTDVNWIIYMRERAAGREDLGILFGAGLMLWLNWIIATAPGYLLGAIVSDPRTFGLDVIMPSFMTAMLVPLWKGHRQTLVWAVAGATSLAVAWLVPGYWFIVVGAVAGAIAGALRDD